MRRFGSTKNIENQSKMASRSRAIVSSTFVAIAMLASSTSIAADEFKTPKILMLGDSQLSFGAGEVVLDFFDNLKMRCDDIVDQTMLLDELQKMRTTLIGARSSSLQPWTTTGGWAYDKLCKKDKTWGVNASIWGHGRKENVPYVQIGEHKDYQFCKSGKTPIQALFEAGYNPNLLIFNILGNNAKRWANNPKSADMDVMKFIEQTPAHIPCIYMTTLPIHTKRRNTQRFKAQEAIRAAFSKAGNRCVFVQTLDKKTISLVQGHNKYFKRKKNGRVKDPFHPQKAAARKVYQLKNTEICKAIEKAFMPKVVASSTLDTKMQDIPPHANAVNVSFGYELRGTIQ